MATPGYGYWEGLAVRFTAREGWLFSTRTRRWETVYPAELYENARLLSRDEFERQFPSVPPLPPLPPEAFR